MKGDSLHQEIKMSIFKCRVGAVSSPVLLLLFSVKLSNIHHGFPLKKGDVRLTYSYAVPNSSMNAVFHEFTNSFAVFQYVDTHIIRYKYLTVMTFNYKIH